MRVAFYTLGCKVNQYDTQTMMLSFQNAGHEIVEFKADADCYVINTCTVTAVSDKKSRQMIARAHKRRKDAVICVAGCFAQKDAQAALALDGVRLVLGNQERGRIVEHVERLLSDRSEIIDAVNKFSPKTDFEELPAICEGRTRATLKIQEGCNQFCSYCIIPYARGPIRSRKMENITEECRRLADAGFSEFVLTGIHLASYSGENGERLIDVIEAMSKIDGAGRIRLGSLEPALLTEDFIGRAANIDELCKHFHVSMQSGSDTVLERMKRHYSSEIYASHVEKLREAMPDAAITTDIIAGFPGESNEEHKETLEFVKRIRFSKIHVFPFSAREGTPAASMTNQLDGSTKDRRTHELISLGKHLEHEYIDRFIGREQEVLVEEQSDAGVFRGHTPNYLYVSLAEGSRVESGEFHKVRLLSRSGDDIYAELLN